MNNPRVVILGTIDEPLAKDIHHRFGSIHLKNPENWSGQIPNRHEVEAIIMRSPFTLRADEIDFFPKLRGVIRAGSGLDGIDVESLTQRNIRFYRCSGNANGVAELVFGMILSLCRRIAVNHQSLIDGHWEKFSQVDEEIYSKNITIVGYGQVGQRVAAIAKAFAMNINIVEHDSNLVHKVGLASRIGASITANLKSCLGSTDVLVLCCPLTDQTKYLINSDVLNQMKDSAIVINVARGGVWSFSEVIAALDRGDIGGAGVDVYEIEPPVDYSQFTHPLLCATPHIGGQTKQSQQRIASSIKTKLESILL